MKKDELIKECVELEKLIDECLTAEKKVKVFCANILRRDAFVPPSRDEDVSVFYTKTKNYLKESLYETVTEDEEK